MKSAALLAVLIIMTSLLGGCTGRCDRPREPRQAEAVIEFGDVSDAETLRSYFNESGWRYRGSEPSAARDTFSKENDTASVSANVMSTPRTTVWLRHSRYVNSTEQAESALSEFVGPIASGLSAALGRGEPRVEYEGGADVCGPI